VAIAIAIAIQHYSYGNANVPKGPPGSGEIGAWADAVC